MAGNLEPKTSIPGAPPHKKKSMKIRAQSAKQRKYDNIRVLLIEHLSEKRALIQHEVPVPVEVRSCQVLMDLVVLRCLAQGMHIIRRE